MQNYIRTLWFQRLLLGVAILILLLSSFLLGVIAGERRSRHFSRLPQGFAPTQERRAMPQMNGAFGKVSDVNGQEFTIHGNGVQQRVFTTSSTVIRRGDQVGTFSDVTSGTDAAVFGQPNEQGQIEARLIRLH